MKSEYHMWVEYLTVQPQHVKDMWVKLASAVDDISLPIAGPCGELGYQFAWSSKNCYLDIDLSNDGCFEWFFANLKTGETLGSSYLLSGEIPVELIEVFGLIA